MATRDELLSSDAAFSSEEEELALEEPTKSKRPTKQAAFDDKDPEEEELERLVLGDSNRFRLQLFKDDYLNLDADDTNNLQLVGPNADTGLGHVNDTDLFILDTGIQPRTDPETDPAKQQQQGQPQQEEHAWEDSDDERLTVSLAGATRLRKLRIAEDEDVVNGTEYTKRLRQQYLKLNPMPTWAKKATVARSTRRGRRRRNSDSSASSAETASGASDADDDDDADGEGEDFATQPLANLLRDAASMSAASAKKRKLRPETIDIQRTRDIPVKHKAAVTSLAFHPAHAILLSASRASIMHLHRIDAAAHPTPNPELLAVQAKQVDVRRCEFQHPAGGRIVFAGRRRYIHSWNLESGLVQKTTQIQGHAGEFKSMEHFRLSPCGRWLAVQASARKGGGTLSIVNAATMQWVADARLDSRHGIADFAWWRSGDGLTILGKDGRVGEWSVVARAFVGVWHDHGCVGGIVVALGGAQGPAALGGDRWVAIGSNSGITNLYDRRQLLELGAAGAEAAVLVEQPVPARSFEQLVTPVTTVVFSPDGQLLAFASQAKKDALRLVHLPSCTVYRNWPTQQTPLGRVTAVAFGRHDAVLAVGNDAGKIRLWEIRN